MIKLDKNYSVAINGIHGFELHYRGEEKTKEVQTEKGVVVKDITPNDMWYYPKLSMILNKYFSVNLGGDNIEELKGTVLRIEQSINSFSKTFAVKGELLKTK